MYVYETNYTVLLREIYYIDRAISWIKRQVSSLSHIDYMHAVLSIKRNIKKRENRMNAIN